jgi:hypothetical protein
MGPMSCDGALSGRWGLLANGLALLWTSWLETIVAFSFSEEDTIVLSVSALYQMNFILIEKQKNLNEVGESELAPMSNSTS